MYSGYNDFITDRVEDLDPKIGIENCKTMIEQIQTLQTKDKSIPKYKRECKF